MAARTLWTPHPENLPQQEAYALADVVDEMFYGGAAGGGKTDLGLGVAVNKHKRSLILRREFTQLDGLIERSKEIVGLVGQYNEGKAVWRDLPGGGQLRFGGCQQEDDKQNFQGRPRDFIMFDEASQFLESQVDFITGWLRHEDPHQHCLVLYTSNPPTTAEGYWVIERFAAWLDPHHPNPAQPGEVRWYARLDGKWVERPDGQPFEHDSETITPKSRTFIPAGVDDNPYYRDSGYKAQLQALPEPLRSQMLKGDFTAGQDDDPWQVIPTAWVQVAQERWTERRQPDSPCDAMGVDVARGGKDQTMIAKRFGSWFAPLERYPGSATPDGPMVAALVVQAATGYQPVINVDVIGVGSSVYDALAAQGELWVIGVNVAEKSEVRDKSGKLGFVNKRAELYWQMREALDPQTGDDIALPPDRELLADLCAARWKLTVRGIQVELKEDIKKRLGRSPDSGDAVVLALPSAQVGHILTGARKRETAHGIPR